jgi:NAD+ kinase
MPSYVALCPNPFRDVGLTVTQKAMALLGDAGFTTLCCPVASGGEPVPEIEGVAYTGLEQAAAQAGLLVSLGGDGTILRAARAVYKTPKPIIGVNLGSKGFMAEIEPSELDLVVACAKGGYTIQRRMMADVTLLRNGQVIYADCCLNDAALAGVTNMLRIFAFSDGQKITEFSGDGIVLSTPTGSTAYSMSAGGPLVEPTSENLILTPICAHELSPRSFVLRPDRLISVMPDIRRGRHALLSVDGGQPVKLLSGDEITFRKSDSVTLLAHAGRRSFYDMAFQKLGRVK